MLWHEHLWQHLEIFTCFQIVFENIVSINFKLKQSVLLCCWLLGVKPPVSLLCVQKVFVTLLVLNRHISMYLIHDSCHLIHIVFIKIDDSKWNPTTVDFINISSVYRNGVYHDTSCSICCMIIINKQTMSPCCTCTCVHYFETSTFKCSFMLHRSLWLVFQKWWLGEALKERERSIWSLAAYSWTQCNDLVCWWIYWNGSSWPHCLLEPAWPSIWLYCTTCYGFFVCIDWSLLSNCVFICVISCNWLSCKIMLD